MNEVRHADALLTREASTTPVIRDLAGLLDALRASAARRDREGGHAAQEKQWIADAGLLTLAVPPEFGGPGARWIDIYETIRQIARVDSALAHLLGFTCLQVVSVNIWGNAEQRARYLNGTVEHRWWWGNAVNPLDTRLIATASGDGGYLLDGQKGF
ncbi:MAG TPA: acyl-CoA dehydrogenase family protein, partial [Paraburkholderia sp.]